MDAGLGADVEFLKMPFEQGRCIALAATLFHNTKTDVGFDRDFRAILDMGATSTHVSKTLLPKTGHKSTSHHREALRISSEFFITLNTTKAILIRPIRQPQILFARDKANFALDKMRLLS